MYIADKHQFPSLGPLPPACAEPLHMAAAVLQQLVDTTEGTRHLAFSTDVIEIDPFAQKYNISGVTTRFFAERPDEESPWNIDASLPRAIVEKRGTSIRWKDLIMDHVELTLTPRTAQPLQLQAWRRELHLPDDTEYSTAKRGGFMAAATLPSALRSLQGASMLLQKTFTDMHERNFWEIDRL